METDLSPQIKKFGAKSLDAAPANWLERDHTGLISTGVDMVVVGSIYVLTPEGTIQRFHRGDRENEIPLDPLAENSSFVGLDRGSVTDTLYVVEVNNDAARLTRVDPDSGDTTHFLPPARHPADDSSGTALAQTTDFVVDEVTGVVFFLTPTGLWRGEFS